MARNDRYEPNRFLGFPVGKDFLARKGARTGDDKDPQARTDAEPQRVMGFPADWFEPVDLDWLESLAHPIRACRRWARHRRP